MFKDLTKEQKIKKLEGLKHLEDMMKDYDIYLHFGTLLGCVRHNDFISHDYDLDVSYLSKYHKPIEILNEMKQIYIMLRDKHKALIKYWDINRKEIKNINNIVDSYGQAHILCGENIITDLFTTWIDENNNYWTCQWGLLDTGRGLKLIKGNILGFEFKIPKYYDSILTNLYGDWKTPRKYGVHLKGDSYLKLLLNNI